MLFLPLLLLRWSHDSGIVDRRARLLLLLPLSSSLLFLLLQPTLLGIEEGALRLGGAAHAAHYRSGAIGGGRYIPSSLVDFAGEESHGVR